MQLEDILTKRGLLDSRALAKARQRAEADAMPLVAVLVDLDLLDEETLAEAIAAETGVPVMDISDERVEWEVLQSLPEELAIRHLVLPLELSSLGDKVRVAFANPADPAARAVVAERASGDVEPMVATVSALRSMIAREYGGTRTNHGAQTGDMESEVTRRVDFQVDKPTGESSPPVFSTVPMHRFEQEATIEQRHEALLLALVEAGVIARSDYVSALRRLMGRSS